MHRLHRLLVHGAPASHGPRALELGPSGPVVQAGPCRVTDTGRSSASGASGRPCGRLRNSRVRAASRAQKIPRYLLCVSGGRLPGELNPASRGPSHSVHGPGSVIIATPRNEPSTCRYVRAAYRNRTDALRITRGPIPACKYTSCTDTTDHRTDGTRRAGTVQGPRSTPAPLRRAVLFTVCNVTKGPASRAHEYVPPSGGHRITGHSTHAGLAITIGGDQAEKTTTRTWRTCGLQPP